jgi:regulator of protease activity HflC (stomatin/prohibitin superfamily)
MNLTAVFIGVVVVFVFGGILYALFSILTLQVREHSECFLLNAGRLEKSFWKPGLHFAPKKILPWVEVISVSKQIDYRTYRSIQVNDRYGTTVVVDLWIEFRITDPYKALFGVENWEEVLQSVVVHTTASILSSESVEEILAHRSELAEQLKKSLAYETERWGISLSDAMIQNIGLLSDITKQFFQAVAARIERTTAIVKEEGRLEVVKLEAATSRKISELNGLARSQMPIEIANFYREISLEPGLLEKFQEYWDLLNLDPRKTITFSGFNENQMQVVEAAKAVESIIGH